MYSKGDSAGTSWMGGYQNGTSYAPKLDLYFVKENTFFAVDDASVFEAYPDSTANGFNASNLFVSAVHDTAEAMSYVKFNLTGLANKTISQAAFSLRGDMATVGKTMTMVLRKSNNDNFTRDTTTWNNDPGTSSNLAYGTMDDDSKTRTYFEQVNNLLVDYINGKLAEGNEVVSLAIRFSSGDSAHFGWLGGVGNGSSYAPRLDLTVEKEFVAYSKDDATVFEAYPDSTALWKNASNIFVSLAHDTAEVISYVKFDIAKLPNKQVRAVEFSTRGDIADGKTITMVLRKANNDNFSRDTTTWNNDPGTSTNLAFGTLDDDSKTRTYFEQVGNSLVDYVNSKLIEGKTEISFALRYSTGDSAGVSWMGGTGNGTYAPQLKLIFADEAAIYAADDATVFEEFPDSTANWKDPNNIFISKGSDTTEVFSYVKFDISNVAFQEVIGVKLSTRSDMADNKTMTVVLRKAKNNNFSRDTTTWNNDPGTKDDLATVMLDMDSGRKIFEEIGNNLLNYVAPLIAEGQQYVSFAILFKDGDSTDLKWMGGVGNGTYAPELRLAFKSDGAVAPIFNPNGGYYEDSVKVADIITHSTNDTVYYTIDGTEPDMSSTIWPEKGITIKTDSTVIKAVTYRYTDTDTTASDTTTSQAYRIRTPKPTILPEGGTYEDSIMVSFVLEGGADVFYYTLDGSEPNETSAIYAEPFKLGLTDKTTVKVIAKRNGYYLSNRVFVNFTVLASIKAPEITPTVQQQYESVTVTITSPEQVGFNGNDSIYYTTDGTEPDNSSLLYAGPFVLNHNPDTLVRNIKAVVYGGGGRYSELAAQIYSIANISEPVIAPAETAQADSVVVTITADAGANIYYTLDGSTPSGTSTQYTAPFVIMYDAGQATQTVKAIAEMGGKFSEVTSKDFTITSTVGINKLNVVSLNAYPNPVNKVLSISNSTLAARLMFKSSIYWAALFLQPCKM
ncbi:MAG: DNRLRE domain-containing protein [Bacteroidales bacterium]|nr:DNRLRE domain-containing protein [Bacteroidales bacterium]